MPDLQNGVRGGSSKRSDRKNRREPASIDGHDASSRTIEETESPIDDLIYSSGALQRLADIAKYFVSSFTTDLREVEDALRPEIETDKTIRGLNETLATLTHVKSEEMEELRLENQKLVAEQEACQEEQKRCLEIQEKLRSQHALTEAERQEESKQTLQEEKLKLHKMFKTKKAETEDEYRKKARDLDEKHAKLSAMNVELKTRCSEAEGKLETKKKRHALMEKSLEDDNKRLTQELKQLRAQFPVEPQPFEYYAQQFEQIFDAIKKISSKYFQQLPEEDMTGSEVVHEELSQLSPIFNATPISSSPISEFLRLRNVEHVICACLCDIIWLPFLPQTNLPDYKAVSQFLDIISTSLLSSGGRSESVWRVLTLRGITGLNNSIPESNQIESTVQQILKTLQPLTLPTSLADLTKDLHSLITTSSTLWTSARKDSANIMLTTQPSSSDKSTWLAVDMPNLSPSSTTTPTPTTTKPHNANPTETLPLLLFPHILYKSPHDGKTTTLHQGVALFPTSRAYMEGLVEKTRHEEEIKKELQDARSRVRARKKSGLVGPGVQLS